MVDSFAGELGGTEGVGSFMALLQEQQPAPQQQASQRLGSLAQPGPGERGEAQQQGSSWGAMQTFEAPAGEVLWLGLLLPSFRGLFRRSG